MHRKLPKPLEIIKACRTSHLSKILKNYFHYRHIYSLSTQMCTQVFQQSGLENLSYIRTFWVILVEVETPIWVRNEYIFWLSGWIENYRNLLKSSRLVEQAISYFHFLRIRITRIHCHTNSSSQKHRTTPPVVWVSSNKFWPRQEKTCNAEEYLLPFAVSNTATASR